MQIGVRLEGASSSPDAKIRGATDTIQSSNRGESFHQDYLSQKQKTEAAAREGTETDLQAAPTPITAPPADRMDLPADTDTVDSHKPSDRDVDTAQNNDLNMIAIHVDEADATKRTIEGQTLLGRMAQSTIETAPETSQTEIGLELSKGHDETRHKGKTDRTILSDPTQDIAIGGHKNDKPRTVFTPSTDTAAIVSIVNQASSPIPQPPKSLAAAANTVNTSATSFNQVISDAQQVSPQQPVVKLQIDTNTAGKISQLISAMSQNEGDQKSRVYVQLDPPELGRLALDFKFDPQGLQQIIITSETQEALKRMRGQHFELVQALQESGIGESSVYYQQSQDNRGRTLPNYDSNENDENTAIATVSTPTITHTYHPNMREKLIANNSLNIII